MPDHLAELDALAKRHSLFLATAESLTCGQLTLTLGGADGSGEWLRGGVVAYDDDVKFTVLGVTPGPVISRECAAQMALGAARLLNARLALAVTGVGGPSSAEGQPPGRVFVAASFDEAVTVEEHNFAGEPESVMSQTVAAAIRLALETTRSNLAAAD